jgi:energy-coupling factor transporter ATP-binding protein EcfA2
VLKGQSRRAARKAAYHVLERIGLDPKLATRYPAQLSGGEQQRVGVARALAADPPILLMDEPFSAVDPVVRSELQREILRLQSELHKTIVFVTHDIDEAVRLADLVPVFGPGGSLQQYDEPARLLPRPANDFVSSFIGAGRGYRWLQFIDVTGLPLHGIQQISESDVSDIGAVQLRDGWALVINQDGVPLGWIDADGMRRYQGGASLSDSVAPVGSLLRPDGNLSQVLDAALSHRRRWGSPSTVKARHRRSSGPRRAGRAGIPTAGPKVHYLIAHRGAAWALTVIHLGLSLVPVLIGLAIAMPLGVLVQRTTMLRRLTTVTASVDLTLGHDAVLEPAKIDYVGVVEIDGVSASFRSGGWPSAWAPPRLRDGEQLQDARPPSFRLGDLVGRLVGALQPGDDRPKRVFRVQQNYSVCIRVYSTAATL